MQPLLEDLALEKEAVNIPPCSHQLWGRSKAWWAWWIMGKIQPSPLYKVQSPTWTLAKGLLAGASWIWWRSVPREGCPPHDGGLLILWACSATGFPHVHTCGYEGYLHGVCSALVALGLGCGTHIFFSWRLQSFSPNTGDRNRDRLCHFSQQMLPSALLLTKYGDRCWSASSYTLNYCQGSGLVPAVEHPRWDFHPCRSQPDAFALLFSSLEFRLQMGFFQAGLNFSVCKDGWMHWG